MEPKLIFFIGGARSGKSMCAQRTVESWRGQLLYLATAEPRDGEMQERIRLHQEARGERWSTLEEPLEVGRAIVGLDESVGGVLLDCLTLWTSNLLERYGDDEEAMMAKLAEAEEALRARRTNIAVVTNEVGLGLVPDNRLARDFRDLAGTINRRIAALADEAWFVAAGRRLRLE